MTADTLRTLAGVVEEAEEKEVKGQYREAAELVAEALNRAYADHVRARGGVSLVRQPSNAMPRRSYVERYKARMRVDWQKWDRMSMRNVVSTVPEADDNDDDWEANGDSDDEDEDKSAPAKPASPYTKNKSASSNPALAGVREEGGGGFEGVRQTRDTVNSVGGAPDDWHPDTLETKQAAGQVELVHTCCDGTKVRTAVAPFAMPPRALHLFNHEPKKTIKALLGGDVALVGEGGRPYTHEEVARWLLTAGRLSKNRIGDYLGRSEEDAQKMLAAFLAPLDFEPFAFDEALRFFLSLFRLPGEAQQIDRIMQHFAEKYYAARPDLFRVADTAYVLAFSLIMLNTDAHSDQIEHKMSLKQFLSNNRGIDEGGDLDTELLTSLYHSIVRNEIRMEQREFITSVKEGWLLKQGGKVKTWKKRYAILSGNVLYYFVSPKDKAPAGFVPLEGIRCRALPDGRTFEIRATDEGKGVKSVKMARDKKGGGGFCGLGGKGKKKGAVFAQGHHAYFSFKTVDAHDSVDAWVTAVEEHSVVDAVAQSVKTTAGQSAKHGGGSEEPLSGTLSFFRGRAKAGTSAKATGAGGNGAAAAKMGTISEGETS